jgi:hypothetical protein
MQQTDNGLAMKPSADPSTRSDSFTLSMDGQSADNDPTADSAGDSLPPPGTTRWVTRRKAQVVEGVRTGLLSLEEACRRYELTVEEFRSWERLIDRHGVDALRVTRLKQYRDPSDAQTAELSGQKND